MSRLREGEIKSFLVEKKLTLPDGSKCFVLTGPDNKKYLLPEHFYRNYNIQPGRSVVCRVDKINCRGEIFLEPENPYYREGESYYFDVIGVSTRVEKTGNEIPVILVRDKSGNIIPVPGGGDSVKPGSAISLTVGRISKGRLVLHPNNIAAGTVKLRAGRYYDFYVERIAKGIDNLDYLVVRDHEGSRSTLPADYYSYYDLKPGSTFRGKVVKNTRSGEKVIEPVNPFYKAGDVLEMRVSCTERNITNHLFTIELIDRYGFFHCIESLLPPKEDLLKCRVMVIKKGRPVLEQL